MGDCTDPLMYLEQCRDYLPLNPLMDDELPSFAMYFMAWLASGEVGNIWDSGNWEHLALTLLNEELWRTITEDRNFGFG